MLAGGRRILTAWGAASRRSTGYGQLLVQRPLKKSTLSINGLNASSTFIDFSPGVRLSSTHRSRVKAPTRTAIHNPEAFLGSKENAARTDRLLAQDIGSLDVNQWQEAEHLFHTWARQPYARPVETVWKILDRLVQEKRHGTDTASSLDTAWLNSAIGAWRKGLSLNKHSRKRFMTPKQVLRKLDEYHPVLLPDMSSYGILADASIVADPAGAPFFCESLFERPDLTPNSHMRYTLAKAWAKSGLPDAGEKVEQMLYEMKATGGDMELDRLYTLAISAWGNSRQNDAPQHAERLFHEMEASKSHKVYPTVFAIAAVINAWTKNNEPGAMQRAEHILNHVWALHNDGKANIKPTSELYRTIIFEYTKRGQPQEAEKLLRQLWGIYTLSHDADLYPDSPLNEAVVFAYATNAEPLKAESFLRDYQAMAETNGDKGLSPSYRSFDSCLVALAKSKSMRTLERAESVLHWMKELSEKGYENAKPSTRHYNCVLSSYAYLAFDDPQCPQRAESLLKTMEDLHKRGDVKVEPTLASYAYVNIAWSRSGRKDAQERMQKLLWHMVNKEPNVLHQ